jgi:hypothetical protein
MPNIHITFGETEATEIECIPMKVLVGTKPAYDVHVFSDPITITSHGTTTERRRRSWWKRTKKFVRRMFVVRNIAYSLKHNTVQIVQLF